MTRRFCTIKTNSLNQQSIDHHAGLAPAIGRVANQRPKQHAGGGKGRHHQPDHERRRAKVGYVDRDCRLQDEMVARNRETVRCRATRKRASREDQIELRSSKL